jgi:DNA repair protein RecN (Recombination protein N)
MIRSLSVSNYALIEELEIQFSGGLTTITGETGAGKSILLGALGLILGNRGDTGVLKNKELKCIVEGIFRFNNNKFTSFLQSNEIDPDDSVILRREISPNGKSRAFINDTPVSLQVLKEAGDFLIDIHSQHENLDLNHNLYQLGVLDAYSGSAGMLEAYQLEYRKFTAIAKELENLKSESEKARAELDFLNFQFNELDQSKLKDGESEDLEQQLETLSHAEEIKTGLFSVYQAISGDETNVVNLLKDTENTLVRLEKFYPTAATLRQRIASTVIELRDISSELEKLADKTEVDPATLEKIQERLNLLYSLVQKHRVKTVEELIRLRDDMDNRILDLSSSEFRIEELEKELVIRESGVKEIAHKLSLHRTGAIPSMETTIVELLVQLGIPNAQFKIQNLATEVPGLYGIDAVKFLFTANRKTEMQDIAKIASGGELSRLMLSIKSIVTGSLGLPTIIFDEIDTGVSGEIAYRVGKIMKEMSSGRQVFAITHLPQVAAKGDQHFLVYKDEKESGTRTEIRQLDKNDRLVEIARMLSGEQTTDAAMANARELLS